MKLVTLPAGTPGIDCNFPLNEVQAKAVKDHGFEFVIRYIPRLQASPKDLKPLEIDIILEAGLALGVVQHVQNENAWAPTGELGTSYGTTAETYCRDTLRLPDGAVVWNDLEGTATSAQAVIDYCHAWYAQLTSFDPGLYVGWHSGLTPQQLYDLPFKRYWGALNLDEDQFPAVRGLQLKQHESRGVRIPGFDNSLFDTNTVLQDHKGDLPIFIGA